MTALLEPMSEQEVVETRRWLPWIAALMIAAALGWMALSGSDSPDRPAPTAGPHGHPEVIADGIPAFVQEGIIYGEVDASDPIAVEILPAYVVESIYYGEMEPPTGS